MAETSHSKTEAQAPQAQLIQMATGHWISSLVYFAAQMKLADQLAEGPKTADELALLIAADAPSLYRVMRTLCGIGLFTEEFQPPLFADAPWRGSQDRHARLSPFVCAHTSRRTEHEVSGPVGLFGPNRKDRIRESLRHAIVRMAGKPSGRGVHVQRNHDWPSCRGTGRGGRGI